MIKNNLSRHLFNMALGACLSISFVACDSDSNSATESATNVATENVSRTISFYAADFGELTCKNAIVVPGDQVATLDSAYDTCEHLDSLAKNDPIIPGDRHQMFTLDDSVGIYDGVVCYDQKWNYVTNDSCELTSLIITCNDSLATPVPADHIEYIENLVGDCSNGRAFDGYTIEDSNGDTVLVRCRAGKWEYADAASCGKASLCREYHKNSDWGQVISNCDKENEGAVTDTECYRSPKQDRDAPGYYKCQNGSWEPILYVDYICARLDLAVGDTCSVQDPSNTLFTGMTQPITYTTYVYTENGEWVKKED